MKTTQFFGGEPPPPLPLPRQLYSPDAGSGEGYSWRHFAAYGHLAVPPFLDAVTGQKLGADGETDKGDEKDAALLKLLESARLKMDFFKGVERLQPSPSQGCVNFRQVPGFNIFGMAQSTLMALKEIVPCIISKTSCEEIHWVSLRPDPIIYVYGQSFGAADAMSLQNRPSFPCIPGWGMQRVENEFVNIVRARVKVAANQMQFYKESYSDIPEERINTEQTVRLDDLNNVVTLKRVLNEIRKENEIAIKDIRLPLFTTTPTVGDLDELVTMVKSKSKMAVFVFTSHAGMGRTTTSMVCACLVQHAVMGRGDFGEEKEEIVVPEILQSNPLISIVIKQTTGCPIPSPRKSISQKVEEKSHILKDVVVFFIVGGSGCGKGTQCQKLKAEFPLTHISSGDLLRAEETSGSSLGMELRKIMEYGELVPMMTVLTMIQNAMQKAIEGGARGFLIDGYPRDEQQGAMFESLIHPCHACIFYDASNQTMFKRMMQRGRHDDNELTVTEKLKTFQLHSGAVLDYYKKRQKLIEIDAEASPDKVFERSLEGLQKSLLKDLTVIFVLGGPASGKDVKSLCEKLKEAFNLSHISIAELVKNEIESKSDLGRQLKKITETEELVPTQTIHHMIRKVMMRAVIQERSKGFLIDISPGYLNKLEQGVLFESLIHPCRMCIYYNADKYNETMLQRTIERDETGKRSDDEKDKIKKRLEMFHKHSQFFIDYYKRKKKLIEIHAEDSIESVFEKTVDAIKMLLLKNIGVMFIIGGPGCGKGTQCARLKEHYKMTHISSGDLLREEVAVGTVLGKKLQATMERGELVPMKTVLKMIKYAMIKAVMEGSTGFLIDGYPREEEQGKLFESEIHPCQACIYFMVGDETMLERMMKRAETSERADDNEFTMKERLKTFHNHAQPVIDYFRDKGKLIKIPAEAEPDVVFYRTTEEISSLLLKKATVFFIVGGPGCGKGTQCSRLQEAFKLKHISSGDLLRDEMVSGSKLGKSIEHTIQKGKLVPTKIVKRMIKIAMVKAAMRGMKGFLIDGYPRCEEQGVLFEQNICPCKLCIYYNVADQTMLERMKKRAETSDRLDDNDFTMQEKLKTFHEHLEPLIGHYKKAGKLIEIDAENSPGVVFQKSVEAIKKFLLQKISVLFIIGGPGCGKGTQCERLKETFHLSHISSGDLLRDEVQSDSKLGKQLQQIMNKGELVPMRTVLIMIQNAMIQSVIQGYKGFLIDGYPREREQGVLFESEVYPSKICLYYNVADKTMLQRMKKRAETSGRTDDNEKTMIQRLKTFHNHAQPVIDYYKKSGKLVEIQAEDSPDIVFGKSVEGIKSLMLNKIAVIFVIGGPGCGKGTQCERLKELYNLDHISSGDLLRDEVASGSEMGRNLHQIMKKGELVPMETVLTMIQNSMIQSVMRGTKGFLIDGYPRVEAQGILFETKIHTCNVCLYFNCSDETMLLRIRKRALTSGRADDNEATMRERLNIFHQHSKPVIDYYKKAGKLIEIQAEDHPDHVFKSTIQKMSMLLLKDSTVIFIIGGPGSGKGTQCAKLGESYGIKHISTGDLLRKESSSGSVIGQHLQQTMQQGDLVPLNTVMLLIQNAMVQAAMLGFKGFLIDGYPREIQQGIVFEANIHACHLCIYYKVSEATMLKRIKSGAETSGRVDDDDIVLMSQLKTFHKRSEAVINFYRTKGKLVEILAEDSIEEVLRKSVMALRLFLFKNLKIVFIIGGPGCGKGTQCEKLKETFKLTHISSGDLLREEVASESEMGRELQAMMTRGELVPMRTILTMIKNAMLQAVISGSHGFLIDGYPREEVQGILFESEIHPCQVCICYNVSDDTMMQRMKKRAETSGREDDNEATMMERLKTFHNHSLPVIMYYRNQEKLFEIHAEEEANVVFNKSLEAFKKYFLKNLIVIFIIGGPGCGKGTQCERLKEAYQLIHISSGDLLREEVTSGSEMGKELQAIMEKGELVPMMTVLTMIRKVMLKAVMSGARGFLIDGYPREKEQGILFESEIHPCQACVYYNVDDATMIQRMRWRSLTSGRADDNDATMKLRLQTFHSHSEPVIAHYREAGKLVEIPAENSTEYVFGRTVEALKKRSIHPTHGRFSDNNLQAVDELTRKFPDGEAAKTILDQAIDLCGSPPGGVKNLRDAIFLARDSLVNGSEEQRPHWDVQGRTLLGRYLHLICFSCYLRAHNKFEVSFAEFRKENYRIWDFIQKSVDGFQWN